MMPRRFYPRLQTVGAALLLMVMFEPMPAVAGVEVDCEGSARAYAAQGIPCWCENGRIVCKQSPSSSSKKRLSGKNAVKLQLFQGVLESVFSSLLETPKGPTPEEIAAERKLEEQKKQEEERKKREALARWNTLQEEEAANRAYEDDLKQKAGQDLLSRMGSTKGAAFKTLANSSLPFKTLGGDAETLAAAAREPFDTVAETTEPEPGAMTAGSATPFFGDTMPHEDIQTLINPGNDPRVVDLRNAVTFIAENLMNNGDPLAASGQPITEDKKLGSQECKDLSRKLRGYIEQRSKFQKTILLAQDQLTTWEKANRKAMIDQTRDGLEYFAGVYLDVLSNRGAAAERLRMIFEKNAASMARDGVDIAEIEAKIRRLKVLSSRGDLSAIVNNANDWQTFVKDGVSSLVAQMTTSNSEIKDMMADPRMEQYFTADAPELNFLLDISKFSATCKVFGKEVAKKVPMIALLEISTKTTYNAWAWFDSFHHILESNKINGQVMNSARSLQKHIDDTYLALRECE